MSEINQKIIEMISNQASANEIASATGLSNKQLFYRLHMLKSKGYNFYRKYYYDGEIVYGLYKGFENMRGGKKNCLYTSSKDKVIKMALISDLHFAHKKDRVDLLNRVYEFCVKEGIHIIINGGDILDGFVGDINSKKFVTSDEQIQYLLDHYPYDKSIINFTCLGNHDYSILQKTGQNLGTVLVAHRHDIVSLGYGVGKLKIKNDEITVVHPKTPINQISKSTRGLVLAGHSHKSQSVINGNLVKIFLPTLSDMSASFPSFVIASINFNNGVLCDSKFEQYVFADRLYKVNESNYQIRNKNKSKHIKYEENRVPYRDKEKVKK